MSMAEGIPFVVVNGVEVVREGKTVAGALPGRAVMGAYAAGRR